MTPYRPQIELNAVADCPDQYRITSTDIGPPDGVSFEDHYVNFSGYFGAHGPDVFHAAPELLAFAEAVARYAGTCGDDYLADQSRAAIAKARGGTQ